MTTYAWPSTRTFTPQHCELRVIDNTQRAAESSLSGYVQTSSMPGARWGWAMDFAPHTAAERDELESFILRLNGRQHRVQLRDIQRPRPRGSIVLTGVTVGASAAQFATSLVLAGCRAPKNLVTGSSFEFDTSGDGLADGWTLAVSGTTGALSNSTPAGPMHSGAASKYQVVSAATLNGFVGVFRTVAVTAGLPYALSADVDATAGSTIELAINWRTAGGVFISQSLLSAAAASPSRRAFAATAPGTAALADIYVLVRSTAGTAVSLSVDQVQFEQAAAATAYQGTATLEPGDWLGLPTGQLVRVVERAESDDAGRMTVNFVHMLRAALTSGTAVTLDSPTALFVRTEAPLSLGRDPAGQRPGMSIEFAEVFA